MIDRYEHDGFAFPVDVVDESLAADLRADLEAAESQLAGDPDRVALLHFYPARLLPSFDALVRHPRLLSLIRGVLGPDLLVWSSGVFVKEARSPNYVSWHQDLTYWGFEGAHEVTAWVALTPSTAENGCMRFMPGTHRKAVPHVDTFHRDNMLTRGQEVAVEVDESAAVLVLLAAGQASLHHGRLFHASGPNTTDERRIGAAIRYITPAMRQRSGDRPLVTLVSGRDDHGHFTVAGAPAGSLLESEFALCARDMAIRSRLLYDGVEDGVTARRLGREDPRDPAGGGHR